MKNSVLLVSLLLGVLSFTFCSNPTPKQVEEQEVVSETVTEPRQKTADLVFLNVEGQRVSLSDLKGKVVFINFWATWCPPCINEMPTIDKLKNHFKGSDELIFLMVDIDNQIEVSTAFMKEYGYDLPVYTVQGEIPTTYLGNSIPTTVLLDKSGEIFMRLEGGRDYFSKEMIEIIDEMLKNKS